VSQQIEFGILGPLEVRVARRAVPVPPGRQHTVLATLLLRADRPVSVDFLIDAVWGDRPPPTATNQIACCVCRLRRALVAAGADADLIGTRHPGYLLQLGDARLDVRQVERDVERARAVVDQSRRQAADLLRGALARWRGPVLSEVDSRALRPETERLEERRLELVEEWAEVALHLAAHDDRIATLSAAATEQPLRERLHGQLMLALYSAGRQAEALAVYRALRRRLRDGLGIEPIPAVRRLHEAMLRGDPGLVQARVAPPPVSRSP
jgi:DNA-binding SARP family transcriptional activator